MNCPKCGNKLHCENCGEDITEYFKRQGKRGGKKGGVKKGKQKARGNSEYYSRLAKSGKASKELFG